MHVRKYQDAPQSVPVDRLLELNALGQRAFGARGIDPPDQDPVRFVWQMCDADSRNTTLPPPWSLRGGRVVPAMRVHQDVKRIAAQSARDKAADPAWDYREDEVNSKHKLSAAESGI